MFTLLLTTEDDLLPPAVRVKQKSMKIIIKINIIFITIALVVPETLRKLIQILSSHTVYFLNNK
jgi:hypothetical protein